MRGDKMIAGVPIIDGTMSTISTRPLQNKVITEAVNDLNDRINQIAPGGVYTKSEIDAFLADKADVATTYTKTEVDAIFAALYPIGSLYLGTQSSCPLATIIPGSTWELVAQDKSLQGSSNNHAATDEVPAGLPNIKGSLMVNASTRSGGYSNSSTGAFYPTELGNPAMDGGDHSANGWSRQNFDASRSSAIYGASTTVQPPAYVVNIWRRTA